MLCFSLILSWDFPMQLFAIGIGYVIESITDNFDIECELNVGESGCIYLSFNTLILNEDNNNKFSYVGKWKPDIFVRVNGNIYHMGIYNWWFIGNINTNLSHNWFDINPHITHKTHV